MGTIDCQCRRQVLLPGLGLLRPREDQAEASSTLVPKRGTLAGVGVRGHAGTATLHEDAPPALPRGTAACCGATAGRPPASRLFVRWQLFWEKKLSGLNAFDIAEELVKTMDLPKGLQGNPRRGVGLGRVGGWRGRTGVEGWVWRGCGTRAVLQGGP